MVTKLDSAPVPVTTNNQRATSAMLDIARAFNTTMRGVGALLSGQSMAATSIHAHAANQLIAARATKHKSMRDERLNTFGELCFGEKACEPINVANDCTSASNGRFLSTGTTTTGTGPGTGAGAGTGAGIGIGGDGGGEAYEGGDLGCARTPASHAKTCIGLPALTLSGGGLPMSVGEDGIGSRTGFGRAASFATASSAFIEEDGKLCEIAAVSTCSWPSWSSSPSRGVRIRTNPVPSGSGRHLLDNIPVSYTHLTLPTKA